jgi:hypothetical protein
MALSCLPETAEIIHCQYFLTYICLNNNLSKSHYYGNLSFSLNGANEIDISKLDKRLPKNATKIGDHLSIISEGNDVQRLFYF